MRVHTIRIFLLIVIGAVINISVSWACAIWSVGGELYTIYFDDSVPPTRLTSDDKAWLRSRGWESAPNETTAYCGQVNAFGFSYIEYHCIPTLAPGPNSSDDVYVDWHRPIVMRTDCGWPCYSLGAEVWIVPEIYAQWEADEEIYIDDLYNYVGCIEIFVEVDYEGGRDKIARPLPLRPIWPGFAINTIFYAVLAWCITLVFFTARRIIRRKRGLCIKCGYDLRGEYSSGCTECGCGRDDISTQGEIKET